MLKANTLRNWDSVVGKISEPKSNEAKNLKKISGKEENSRSKIKPHSGSFSISEDVQALRPKGKYQLDSVGPSPSKHSTQKEK